MLSFFRALFKLIEIIRAGTCPLHSCPLESEVTEVTLGLSRRSPSYQRARRLYFPLAHTSFIKAARSAKPKKSKFCPSCRKAEEKWLTENSIDWSDAFGYGKTFKPPF